MTTEPRIGLLYPTRDCGEDDFLDLAARLSPQLQLELCYLPWPSDVDDLAALDLEQVTDALRRLGSSAHLEAVLPDVVAGSDLDAVLFAITSSSFLGGRAGVAAQLAVLADLTGCPATSTTVAYQQAVRHLGLHTVSLASVYHPSVADHFVDRVREAGAAVVHRFDASARSDRELAAWPPERIEDLVRKATHPAAQAVLLPETALHTSGIVAGLERIAGCPVLTATGVSLWAAGRLVDAHPTAVDAGPLFRPTT